ncbi:MAG: hypothetical protein ACRC4M_01215 [Mycoplasma sp.]
MAKTKKIKVERKEKVRGVDVSVRAVNSRMKDVDLNTFTDRDKILKSFRDSALVFYGKDSGKVRKELSNENLKNISRSYSKTKRGMNAFEKRVNKMINEFGLGGQGVRFVNDKSGNKDFKFISKMKQKGKLNSSTRARVKTSKEEGHGIEKIVKDMGEMYGIFSPLSLGEYEDRLIRFRDEFEAKTNYLTEGLSDSEFAELFLDFGENGGDFLEILSEYLK